MSEQKTCPACRLNRRAGFLHRQVGAWLAAPEDAPPGDWPWICASCGYEDDGNRPQLSPHHVPFPVPAIHTKVEP